MPNLRGYKPGFYKDLEVLAEAEEALWDTGKMIITHPKSWIDVLKLGVAGTKHMLRGSSTRTTSVPVSQNTTQSLTQSTMPIEEFDAGANQAEAWRMYKRKRSNSLASSSLSVSNSSTSYGSLAQAENTKAVKIKERRKRIIGNYKPKRYTPKDFLDSLFPTYTLKERVVDADPSSLCSAVGSQTVTGQFGNDWIDRMFSKVYLRAIYNKMIKDINLFGNYTTQIDTFGLPDTSRVKTTDLMPLCGYNISRTYKLLNTTNSPSKVTVYEFLCKAQSNHLPRSLWIEDLKEEFAPLYVAQLSQAAPTTSQTIAITDPGRKPKVSEGNLGRFWNCVRVTEYEAPPMGIVTHNIYYPGLEVSVHDLFLQSSTDTLGNEAADQYLPGITRSIMFVTHGIQGGENGTAGTDNRLLVAPSYWNLQVEQQVTWRCPLQAKLKTFQTVVPTTSAAWSTTATAYSAQDGAGTETVDWHDPATGANESVADQDP